jgi:hypothetical protein
MPAMLRPSKKARKIAYKILGVPANIAYKPNAEQREINRRLIFEETIRVR